MDAYNQVVEFPGILTETNSISPIGNTVSWKVDPMVFLLEDYTMYGESRIVNYWGFVVTGVVILLLIVLLVIKAFRK